jgi:hypothetical protein
MIARGREPLVLAIDVVGSESPTSIKIPLFSAKFAIDRKSTVLEDLNGS